MAGLVPKILKRHLPLSPVDLGASCSNPLVEHSFCSQIDLL